MNEIPDSIYPKYSIIEKEIFGQTHYCVVRHFKFWRLKFDVKMKVYSAYWGNSRFCSTFGQRWNSHRRDAEEAIRNDLSYRKDKYIRKKLK